MEFKLEALVYSDISKYFMNVMSMFLDQIVAYNFESDRYVYIEVGR